jgi:penicillin-binding protein 2
VIEVLPKDRKRFRRLLEESKNFESLPIRTRLSEEEVARFAANRYLFPGVEVKARLFRQYPLGPIAAHAIGYINRINKRDLEIIEENEQAANYKGTDHIGKTGLEQKYEFSCMAKPAMSRSKSTPAAGPFAACRGRRRYRATT